MKARRYSDCDFCGCRITPGTAILYDRHENKTYHETCTNLRLPSKNAERQTFKGRSRTARSAQAAK